ncbi:MAG TPA: sugar kinase [Desulfonatronum sp.]|nr:sugar kinase [Desulfonatronum sp.]
MSWLIVGTVPRVDFPLTWGKYFSNGRTLAVNGLSVNVVRGTPALMATASVTAEVLGIDPPEVLLAGDTGLGQGSRDLYAYLVDNLDRVSHAGLTFHYLQPDVFWHNKILWGLEERVEPPILAADAGFMYVAKMSGFAAHYDLFTPDAGELAFLADENAPHPFYTRGFLLQEEEQVPELIARAHTGKNAARHLLIKGKKDYVVSGGTVVFEVDAPDVPAMEPIGGTGDSLTGLVTALLASGMDMARACRTAALANRYLGLLADPTPAHGVADLLPFLPRAVELALKKTES